MYGVEHLSSDHTHYFLEGVAMPMGMMFDSQASVPAFDVRFTKFLLQFFCRTLVPVVRKVTSIYW